LIYAKNILPTDPWPNQTGTTLSSARGNLNFFTAKNRPRFIKIQTPKKFWFDPHKICPTNGDQSIEA
jgi:hypothetical protein